jgi:hypothetical protein
MLSGFGINEASWDSVPGGLRMQDKISGSDFGPKRTPVYRELADTWFNDGEACLLSAEDKRTFSSIELRSVYCVAVPRAGETCRQIS